MRVRFTKHPGVITGRAVDDAENEELIAFANAQGAALAPGEEPYRKNDETLFMVDFERLGLYYPYFFDSMFADGPIEVDVAAEDMRRLFIR